MAFTYTYDTATPAGSDAPSTIDDRIRETKQSVQERENVDHYWPLTGTEVSDTDAGEHRKVTLRETTKPSAVANKGFLYTKDVAGATELFYEDASGNEKQLTAGGVLNIVAADIPADTINQTKIELANNSHLVASDLAGTGDVNLIKASTSDVPVLGAGAQTASSAAPTEDAGVANKKYVDDQITATTVGARVTTDSLGASLQETTIYRASGAGELRIVDNLNSAGTIYVYAGAVNPPTTVVVRQYNSSIASQYFTVSALIQSGEYVQIVASGTPDTIFWQPFGSGELVPQP